MALMAALHISSVIFIFAPDFSSTKFDADDAATRLILVVCPPHDPAIPTTDEIEFLDPMVSSGLPSGSLDSFTQDCIIFFLGQVKWHVLTPD